MVIDAHQHFWDPARADYPWLEGSEMAPIRRAFGPADLAPLLAENGVDATILVQCRSSIEETVDFLRVAGTTPFLAGVVGWVDLTDQAVGKTLDRLRGSPGGSKLVGIRHQVHDEADPEWLLRGDVRRGLAAVFERELVYDLLVRTRELPAATATARALPHGRFVLDHAAKPPIAEGFSRQWADRLGDTRQTPDNHHHHADNIRTLALSVDEPVDWTRFGIWLTKAVERLQRQPPRLLARADARIHHPVVPPSSVTIGGEIGPHISSEDRSEEARSGH